MTPAEKFIQSISKRSEYLSDKLIFGGQTNHGSFTLSISNGIDLATLKQIRRMISERITDLKREQGL